jgi:hypothetical protein
VEQLTTTVTLEDGVVGDGRIYEKIPSCFALAGGTSNQAESFNSMLFDFSIGRGNRKIPGKRI